MSKDKLPEHIRKELLAAADDLECLAEYALTSSDQKEFIVQFRVLCDKVTSLYSLEAGTYVMKYVWGSRTHFSGIINATCKRIIKTPEWRRFANKFADFILHGNPPGFDEICEIYRNRIEKNLVK